MKLSTILLLLVGSFVLSCCEARILTGARIPEPEAVIYEEPGHARASACSVAIKGGIKDPQPLFVAPGTAEFYPFSATGTIEVAAGQTVELHCPKSFAAPLSGSSAVATCVGGTTFAVGDVQLPMEAIVCTSWPSFTARKSGQACNGGTTLVDVGFQLDAARFLTQYQVCFDEDEEVTRYVHHRLAAGSNYYQTGVDRLTFTTAGFFGGKNVDNLYKTATQMQTIDAALGGDGARYFDVQKNVFLARGHLGAKADYVFGSEQRATFLFLNTAPQWQVFNAGNWQKVEDGVRAWVSQNRLSVECWTGVYGVTTLPNKDGVETPLYLAYDENNNGLIPVPMLYFRVVVEPATGRGVVFVGVNNPHLTLEQIEQDYVLCPDVSDRISWLSWKRSDITAGYSYACEVEEFRKKVADLPAFAVSGLLY